MRRYIIALLVIAFLAGTLFKAADQTGVRLMRMFGTIGIFLFGVVGTLALTRWQSREGLKEVEAALKAAEPDVLITDWALQGAPRPDYLLIGGRGIVAICLADTAQSTGAKRALVEVEKAKERAAKAAVWARQQLDALTAGGLPEGCPADLPISPLVVLTRRRVAPEYTSGEVPVLNAEGLLDHLKHTLVGTVLDEKARIRLTRLLRHSKSS